ncbi:MAG TPA: serine--tRNA ligase, partial [Thermoleophilia bacterium]|nr:serine--tRNA ligase [Thermoleophilia bacterium]
MLDVKMVRANPDEVRRALELRGSSSAVLDEFLSVEEERRRLTTEVESMRSERKKASEAIGARKKAGEDASAEMAATRELGERIKAREAELAVSEARLHELLIALPNIPLADVPEGGEDDSVVLREVGERPAFDFPVKDHVDLGVALDVIDIERAAKVSGSRFAYLKGDLVLLELALVRYGLDAVMAGGFRPVLPPVLVREEAMYGTGFFPTDEQQIYRTTDGECLVGTSEVPL